MEIMGLAVIVILVSIGLFYMIAFTKEPQPEPVKEYTASELATNTIVAMLATDIDDCGTTLEKVIVDKATYQNLPCLRSDDPINKSISLMLENSLQKWGKDYKLTIDYPDTATNTVDIAVPTTPLCGDMRERETGTQPIPLYPVPGTVMVSLSICT
jgi:hypothetical protein